MQAMVDKDTCIGCGLCPTICEQVFGMGDDGKAEVMCEGLGEEVQDAAKEARDSCPVDAISIEA